MMKLRILLLIGLLLSACQPSDPVKGAAVVETTKPVSHEPQTLAAKINDREITLEELDQPIRLGLFDLEWQIYKVRKGQLNKWVATQSEAHLASGSTEPFEVDLFLEPPFPPRLSVPRDQRPIKGDKQAPVRLSVFCSYQSSHCARMQPVLEKIERKYPSQVSFAYYDFPQGFHRYARGAANAVRCAGDQQEGEQSQWDFQSSIYGAYDDLNVERYALIGQQLGFDSEFEACLNQKKYADVVDKDVTLSQSLGLGNVPIILVNGLYIKGPQAFPAYEFYIDHELDRLGLKFEAPHKLQKSNLPLRLQGTFVDETSENSRAIIEFLDMENVQTFYEADKLMEYVFLSEIRNDRIIIDNDGTPEYIMIQQSYGEEDGRASSKNAGNTKVDSGQPRVDRVRVAPEDRALRDKSKVVLSRTWLTNQLSQQAVLASHFQPGEHKASGFNLMKLEDIDDSEFYKTLGLKTGDVIMQVNDEWLHSGQNPLWNALGLTDSIAVTVMRGGRPVRYYYQVKD